jgi:anthranilate phosphoribosyltransferase
MAPLYHGAMRHVGPSRVEMGIRTIFNILGPMANPATVRRLLVGTFSEHWLEPMARVLGNLGAEKAWIVHGADGMDELTTTGPTKVVEFANGSIKSFAVTPQDAGLPTASLDDLKGGTPDENAAAIRSLVDGSPGPFRDIVLLNAAAALLVAGKADTLRDGAETAARGIDGGAAKGALDTMLSIVGK